MEWSSGPGLGWPEWRAARAGREPAAIAEHLGLGWPGDRAARDRPPRLRTALAAVPRETVQASAGAAPTAEPAAAGAAPTA